MQEFWEERYSGKEYAYGEAPNAYLKSRINQLAIKGNILAVADGEGRNGAWLAKNGFDVTSIDGSVNGLKKAEALALNYGTNLRTIAADLTEWKWPEDQYDGIISIFVQFPESLRQKMHHNMVCALKSGGIILMQSFSREQINYQSGGPKNPAMLYTLNDIRTDFAKLSFLEVEEKTVILDEGHFHQGKASVINFLGQKK